MSLARLVRSTAVEELQLLQMRTQASVANAVMIYASILRSW
jgi:hypothetical protein